MASSSSNFGSPIRSIPHPQLQEKISFPVLCCHGIQAKFGVVSKNNENHGRLFYGCPYYPKEGCCSFFLWEDDMLRVASQSKEVGMAETCKSETWEQNPKIEKLKRKNKELKEEMLKAVQSNQKQNMYLKCTWVFIIIMMVVYYWK